MGTHHYFRPLAEIARKNFALDQRKIPGTGSLDHQGEHGIARNIALALVVEWLGRLMNGQVSALNAFGASHGKNKQGATTPSYRQPLSLDAHIEWLCQKELDLRRGTDDRLPNVLKAGCGEMPRALPSLQALDQYPFADENGYFVVMQRGGGETHAAGIFGATADSLLFFEPHAGEYLVSRSRLGEFLTCYEAILSAEVVRSAITQVRIIRQTPWFTPVL